MRAGRDVREEVNSLKFHIGIALCRACAPHAPAHSTLSRLRRECRIPFREPLQFIIIAVMSGTFPDTYGVLP
jgi:hypothetical protein